MKKLMKKLSDVMNYSEWYSMILLVIAISLLLIIGVVTIDQLIDVIRFLIDIEVFVVLSPVFSILVLLVCQVKYPKDKTRNYSKFAKDRM